MEQLSIFDLPPTTCWTCVHYGRAHKECIPLYRDDTGYAHRERDDSCERWAYDTYKAKLDEIRRRKRGDERHH